jgi:ferric-dicitrate binding protein FerR (iron transport regulator)
MEVSTLRGEIKTVVLPDGSKITLNAVSRLKYPDRFTGAERPVELQGEAVFDVASDPARPFTVTTESMNVRVIGTVFNVREYADDRTSSVSVARGKVEVGLLGDKMLLERNRKVKMDKSTGNLEKLNVDAANDLSWTNGTLYFDGTPLREAVNELNRYYPQAEIELAEGEYTGLLSAEFENEQVKTVVLSIADATGLSCKIDGRKYTLYN